MLWRGDAWRLLKLAENGKIELCIAYSMLLELEEVLSYERFESRLQLLEQTPSQLAAYALQLSQAFDVTRSNKPIVTVDPDDDIFILCALEANAKYVVTNDRHLLALKVYGNIPIIRLEEFFVREFHE